MGNTVYLGWDQRETLASHVAIKSLNRSSPDAKIVQLDIDRLTSVGLISRPTDRRDGNYDIISNAPCSTDFAISRFLVPILEQSGWALFCDCDVVFLSDISELFELADDRYAVMVVKHESISTTDIKMDGKEQVAYPRKNWSSVMLVNCNHSANKRLSLNDVNQRPGRDLHAFYWLHDSEIGELPREWNWLVNVEQKPNHPKIAHFTLGGPWLPGWQKAEHDEIWLAALEMA